MGINRNTEYSIQGTKAAKQYENDVYIHFSEYDKKIIQEVIDEINSNGYYIEYTFQLCWIDRFDFEIINPILIKYINRFESKTMRNSFYGYLGQKGNVEVTDFLIEEFKKESNVDETTIDWNSTRRGAASSALLTIMDKQKIDAYIELIENPETKNDCFFIIILLGKLKVKKSIPVIIDLLREDNKKIQSAAIQALYYFRKELDLRLILEPFLQSDYDAIRENARRVLKYYDK